MTKIRRGIPDSFEGRAAVELRITGLSESEIFHLGKAYWEHPLSYGQLRRAFKDAGVETRHKATLARRKGDNIRYDRVSKAPYWERVPGRYQLSGERQGRKAPYLVRRESNAVEPGDRLPWKVKGKFNERRDLTQRELLARQYFFNRSLKADVRLKAGPDMDYYDLYYSQSGTGY